jgi:hypothetical protein
VAAGVADVVVFAVLARALRISEVTEVVGLVTSRMSRGGAAGRRGDG